MPKESIISRSISRHSYLIAKGRGNMRLAKTELGIESYERYKGYSEDEKDVIRDAYDAYIGYANDHISIYEGKHTAAQIRAEVDDYIRYTGRRPVVIVDYLQLVQPSAGLRRATVREQVDDAVDTFVAMRRELKIPVIVISSFNRSSYNAVADNASFKESGTIEYSSDVVITLELDVQHKYNSGSGGATNKEKTDSLEAMRGDNGIRDIKLTFQKNRGNRVGSVIYFKYDARFNYFEEDPDKEAIL
jgi:replicative DNA helicase